MRKSKKKKKKKDNLNESHLIIHQILILRLYESLQKMYCKSTFFLVTDTTLLSGNPLRFRKIPLEKHIKSKHCNLG